MNRAQDKNILVLDVVNRMHHEQYCCFLVEKIVLGDSVTRDLTMEQVFVFYAEREVLAKNVLYTKSEFAMSTKILPLQFLYSL